MNTVETVKIKHKHGEGDTDSHYAIINKSDFDPKKHKLHDDEGDGEHLTKSDSVLAKQKEADRLYDANRGVTGGAPVSGTERNPSGTFSEPTPTDIRYPNKDATEFENNRGAFLRKSAADLRDERGMEDKPGGVLPEHKEAVEAKQAAVQDEMTQQAADAEARRRGRRPAEPTENVDEMTVAQLREYAEKRDIDLEGAQRKDEILAKVKGEG